MAAPEGDPLPAELAARWAEYIEPSERVAFKEACAKATMQSVSDVLRPFFATWTTSLMDSDLEKLRSVSTEPRIRALVEKLVIQDECNILDPFSVPNLPPPNSTYRIWSRDDAGIVTTSETGITELQSMLRKRLLCPSTIIIRDYRLDPINMLLCEELAPFRHLVPDIPRDAGEPVPLAVLTRDVIEGANLSIKSIAFQNADAGYGEHSVLNTDWIRERYPNGVSLAGPFIREAVIELDTPCQGEDTPLSKLRSADLQLGQEAQLYWLHQIFYKAPELKTLKLALRTSKAQQLEAEMVVPKMTEFSLCASKISANDLLAMLASSKDSLTHINFKQVVLHQGSTWWKVLTSIANEYHALTSFSLAIIREAKDGDPAVDFREVREEDVPEQYRAGLKLDSRGPPGNKRTTRLAYSGTDAGKVLEIIAALGYVPQSLESGRRPT